jgi:hypothetical protein
VARWLCSAKFAIRSELIGPADISTPVAAFPWPGGRSPSISRLPDVAQFAMYSREGRVEKCLDDR